MEDAGSDAASVATRNSYRNFVKNEQLWHFMLVAAFALWLWDLLITLDLEITFVWKRNARLINLLYFLVRNLTGNGF